MTSLQRLCGMLVLSALLACSNTAQKSSNKQNDKDTGRPTENGEGVPGYLLGASAIEATVDGATVTLKAPAGTVKGTTESATAVLLVVYETTLAAVFDALAGGNGGKLLATELGRTLAAADGSFAFTSGGYRGGVLILSAAERATEGALVLPTDADAERPSLVFKDPNSPIGFTPLPRPQGEQAQGAVSLQCALGLSNVDNQIMQMVFQTPKVGAQPEACVCDVTRNLDPKHPMGGFFTSVAHPCRVAPVPKAKEALLAAGFVELSKGVCSLPTWTCNIDPTVLAESKSKGTFHAAVGLRELWVDALATCKSYTNGTTMAAPTDMTDEQCATIRGVSVYAGRALTGCLMFDAPGVHPALTAKCLGDSLKGKGPCDYITFVEDICPTSPATAPVKGVFRE